MDIANMRGEFSTRNDPAAIEKMIQQLTILPIDSTKNFSKPQVGKNYGWICPKCGAVYSPHVKECSDCNKPRC